MANKKISELQSRTPALSDLMLVGDPSSGYSYKCTVTALATVIETDIADGYVTIGTTQTISGAKTFSNNLTLTSVVNTPTDPDKFLTLNASNVVTYRTGAEVLSDIGGASASSISGTTNYVAKFTSSSAIGNSAIYSNTSGNVSIGNTNDAYKLDVSGTVRSTSNFVVNNGTVVGNYAIETAQVQIGTFSNHPFVLTTFNTERVRIDTSGNVTFSQIANASTDTDKFLVSDSGVLKYRTGAEVLSDIGAASSSSISGTTNYLAKFTSSSAVGNSQIFDNGTNVGIGTNTPTRTLDVNGIITTNNNLELTSANPTILWTTSNLRFYNNTNGVVATISSAGQLSLSSIPNATTDTDKFLVSDGGVVKYRTGSEVLSDIGAASSSSISGTTNYIPKFTSSSAIGNSIISASSTLITNEFGTSNLYFGQSGSTRFGFASGTATLAFGTGLPLVLGTFDGQPLVFGTNNTEYMRLTSGGSLGIGTSSPAYKLDIYGGASGTRTDVFVANAAANYNIGVLSDNNGFASTTNAMLFYTAASERMRLDASGNLGLGTSAPSASYKFTISGTDAIFPGLYLNNTTNSKDYSLFVGGTSLIIRDVTSTTNRLFLDGSGNLGLGVSPSPSSLVKAFDIAANGQFFADGALYDYSTGIIQNGYRTGNTTWAYKLTGQNAARFELNQSEHRFYIAGSGSSGSAISWTQAMTLDGFGRLGIGSTNPQAPLEIVKTGTLRFNYSSGTGAMFMGDGSADMFLATQVSGAGNNPIGAYMYFKHSNSSIGIGTTSPTQKLSIQNTSGGAWISAGDVVNSANPSLFGSFGDGAAAIYTQAAYPIYFSTNGSERMRITSGGNVLVGGTSDAGYRLDVTGTGRFSGRLAIGSTTNYSALQNANNSGNIYWGIDNSTGSDFTGVAYARFIYSEGAYPLITYVNGAERFSIASTGAATFSSSVTAGGIVSSATEFRLNNQTYSRVATLGSGGDFGGGYNFNWVNGSPVHAETGSISGYGYGNDGSVRFYTNSSQSAGVAASERMRLNSSGELLINTTSDAGDYKLQVNGNSYMKGDLSITSSVANNQATLFFMDAGTTKWQVYKSTSNDFRIYRQGSSVDALTITTSDNAEFAGSIKTAAPSGGTAAAWKLGERVASSGLTLNDTQYIQLDIAGTLYTLATVNLP